jgi:non-homologous end joining protein Ku
MDTFISETELRRQGTRCLGDAVGNGNVARIVCHRRTRYVVLAEEDYALLTHLLHVRALVRHVDSMAQPSDPR